VRPLALLPTFHNAGFAQNLHVIGQGGLADFHLVNQYASTLFTTAKQFQNSKPFFIAEGFKYFSVFLVGVYQTISPHINLF
jgi:hypothetical protein